MATEAEFEHFIDQLPIEWFEGWELTQVIPEDNDIPPERIWGNIVPTLII